MKSLTPDLASFTAQYKEQQVSLLYHRYVNDLETPISAALKLRQSGKPFFLLESVEDGNRRSRYSIIGLNPDITWEAKQGKAIITKEGNISSHKDIMGSFRMLHKACQTTIPDELPPMASGLIGYMSYDMIRLYEPTVPDNNPDTTHIPLGLFMRPTVMVIFDSVTSSIFIIHTITHKEDRSAETCYQQALSTTEEIIKQLNSTAIPTKEEDNSTVTFTSNMSKEEYIAMVERAKEYILAGDIFQVVPSQRFTANFAKDSLSFYRNLRHVNPSPFLFFLDFGRFQLAGSSPEILVRLQDNKVTIRPLAGTRARGKNKEEDARLSKELLADQKEISEHLMLIDLSRNDVGRVCKPGTVQLTEEMVIEYYSHVMHISSNVEGEIDPKHDAIDALFSGLPVGTVSGAPKIRAMQIIDELEKEKRSFYAGCVGYFSASGSMDTCITLRTALIKDQKIHIQAGGGVVAESNPEDEYQESCNKAKALMKAANTS